MPAVVLIETSTGRGSGFYVQARHADHQRSRRAERFVRHPAADGRIERQRARRIARARVRHRDAQGVGAVAPRGRDSDGQRPLAQAGQEIIVIGSALGTLQNSVSRGIVSGLRSSGGATLVQTDAATNPGNSGGPMLDRNGAVIGITTMGYKGAEGLNFGVAIDHARDLLEGRQTNLGSTSGLTEIESQSRGSESDRQQQQGDEQLRARVGPDGECAPR